jgi:hypothetical protein
MRLGLRLAGWRATPDRRVTMTRCLCRQLRADHGDELGASKVPEVGFCSEAGVCHRVLEGSGQAQPCVSLNLRGGGAVGSGQRQCALAQEEAGQAAPPPTARLASPSRGPWHPWRSGRLLECTEGRPSRWARVGVPRSGCSMAPDVCASHRWDESPLLPTPLC